MDNIFRKEYRELNSVEKEQLSKTKDLAFALFEYVTNCYASLPAGDTQRNLSIFKTKLEESVMWATKGLTG